MYVCMYVCMSTFSNIFSSETTGPIKAKFHIEPPWDRGTKVCSNGPGLSMQNWMLEYYQVCSNDEPGLTLTCLTTLISKLVDVVI